MRFKEIWEGTCHTEILREMIRFNWTISDLSFANGSNVHSSTFPKSAPENVGRWLLMVEPNAIFNSYNVVLQQVGKTDITVTVKISVLNCAEFKPNSEMKTNMSFAPTGILRLYDFLERRFVYADHKVGNTGDKVTIACEISVDKWCSDHTEGLAPVESPLSVLVEDMGHLLSSETLADVTIEAGGRQFRAHKAILAARSSVFAAMFRNETVEKKMNFVKITDIGPDVFRQVLEHIYTGSDISHTETLGELLAAAEKYNLRGLKRICKRKICEELLTSRKRKKM